MTEAHRCEHLAQMASVRLKPTTKMIASNTLPLSHLHHLQRVVQISHLPVLQAKPLLIKDVCYIKQCTDEWQSIHWQHLAKVQL